LCLWCSGQYARRQQSLNSKLNLAFITQIFLIRMISAAVLVLSGLRWHYKASME
jgi:hypothetical protein